MIISSDTNWQLLSTRRLAGKALIVGFSSSDSRQLERRGRGFLRLYGKPAIPNDDIGILFL